MSGELYRVLWRRSLIYLREARRLLDEGEYDVALVMAEQSAQLAPRAVYTRVLGYAPRGHNIRRLIGYLASILEEAGRGEEASALRGFVAQHRWELVLLEDAYTQGRYGLPGFTEAEARKGIECALKLLRLLGSMLGERSD